MNDGRLDFPATARNRAAIAQVLAGFWDPAQPLRVLELASGSGQHAAYFASCYPRWTWQPSDLEAAHITSIDAYRREAGLPNLLAPLQLDVLRPVWPKVDSYDAIVAINLIHIAPWECTEALFRQGKAVLGPSASVYLYGAFLRAGQHTAASNEAFDHSLRAQNPHWGVRCLDEVAAVAEAHGFALESVIEMPANNLSALFRRG